MKQSALRLLKVKYETYLNGDGCGARQDGAAVVSLYMWTAWVAFFWKERRKRENQDSNPMMESEAVLLEFWKRNRAAERRKKCDLTRRISDLPIQTSVGNVGYPAWVLPLSPLHCNGMIFNVSPTLHPLIYRHPIAYYYYYYYYYYFLWLCSPARAMASSFTRFRDHTQRHATVGRTPLGKWSSRRRDL
jgi:hypothetical protein